MAAEFRGWSRDSNRSFESTMVTATP
jgi:hypothetical protein